MVEACSGMRGDLDAVRWYIAPPSVSLRDDHGRVVDALYSTREHAITLQPGLERDGRLVRHEMLHAISNGAAHSRDLFVRRCGGVVSCAAGCLSDAGPAAPADPLAVAVPPDSLRITVAAIPAMVATGPAGGHVFVVVTATNPAPYPVIATLPPSGDAGPPLTYEYLVAGVGGSVQWNERARVPESVRFGPGESRPFYFDLWTSPGPYQTLDWPALFTVRGAYGEHFAEANGTLDVR